MAVFHFQFYLALIMYEIRNNNCIRGNWNKEGSNKIIKKVEKEDDPLF